MPKLILCMILTLGALSARASIHEVQPDGDLWGVLRGLQAGDEVIVHGGTHRTPGYVMLEWHGTAEAPIIVRAAEGAAPVIEGDPSQNAVNITGEHFRLIGLEITGGSHGLRLYNVHDALLEDLHIHHTGEVALSANIGEHTYYNIIFRGLHIHHTGGHGEGLYLGCNNGGCEFYNNIIEGNWIHDTNHNVSQGDGIEIKQGGYGNVVRDNIIHDTQYPCIIVYGTAGNPQNIIERNAMWNCGDSGIQAAADALIQNNVILNAGNGINSHAHQGAVPSNLIIRNNTVIAASDRCVRGSDWADPSVELYNNAIYCEGGHAARISPADQITVHDNVLLGSVEGLSAGYVQGRSAAEDFVDVDARDAYPSADSPLIGAAAAAAPEVDFNGTPRGASATVGAFEWAECAAGGWALEPGFKVEMAPCGAVDPDAGAAEPDAGPASASVGPAEPDAGSVEPDAHVIEADEGIDPVDEGAESAPEVGLEPDAAVDDDAGSSEADAAPSSGGAADDGCQISHHGAGAPLLLALLLLALRRRRAHHL